MGFHELQLLVHRPRAMNWARARLTARRWPDGSVKRGMGPRPNPETPHGCFSP